MNDNINAEVKQPELPEKPVSSQVLDPDYGRQFVACWLSASHGTIDRDQYVALEKLLS